MVIAGKATTAYMINMEQTFGLVSHSDHAQVAYQGKWERNAGITLKRVSNIQGNFCMRYQGVSSGNMIIVLRTCM